MALPLPDLPTELLLLIAQSHGKSWERILTESVRSTCNQLNEKLMLFYSSTYLTMLDVKMNEDCMTALYSLAHGQLGIHVLSLTIYTTTLIQQTKTSMY
jgi:hypothetical protein